MGSISSVLRMWAVGFVALAVLCFSYAQNQPRRIEPANAPASSFSAMRAETVLARILGPERPHPVGSAENAAVRARIIAEFARLGIRAKTYRAFTCNPWGKLAFVACATVTDILADAIAGRGKAIILLAHYDSVPAGPGSSDDGSGVATVLETVRALRARSAKTLHPVEAVITDGEEAGLLGAYAFLQNPELKNRVGAVINVEARGTRGQSLLFQTSPGDGRLIDLYAAHVPFYATSSLYAEIYKFLPNDTDLTLFIRAGFPSYNFAFADNVHYYHSPLDRRANLDPATLQMQGDNMLGVAAALEETPFAWLKSGDDVYVGVFGAWLPRLPESWAVPLAVAIFFALAWAAWLARPKEPLRWKAFVAAAEMPLGLLLACGISGWLLSFIAQIVSGHPDPTYAHPLAMRVGLGFAVWSMAVLLARRASPWAAAAAAWIWMALLGIVVAIFLPGVSPYFLFPGVVAAVLLLLAANLPGGWAGRAGQAALLGSALAAFAIWFPLAASGESLMGLRLHPLFTTPAAFALMTAMPLLGARAMPRKAWLASFGASAAVAVACAAIAGFLSTYSTVSPQRVDLVYFEKGRGPARWIASTSWKATATEKIPDALIKAAGFAYDAKAWDDLGLGDGYVAQAGAPRYPLPVARVANDRRGRALRVVTLSVAGSKEADGMAFHIPKSAKLVALDLRGQHLASKGWSGDALLLCASPDCRFLDVTLTLASKTPVDLTMAEERYGLPPFGAWLLHARPPTAMASQSGDEAVLTDTVRLR